jgi:predicted dinucleotide-binding enzyme
MTASMMKTGIIGIGSIGSAVATGLARVGHPVVISRRGAARSTALAARR